MGLIEKHKERLESLFAEHNVEKVYLFGSALNQNFSDTSDIDFMVRFKSMDLAGYFDNYLKLKENLKKLLNRDIDLIEEQTLKNPILEQSINRNKKLIYG